METTNTEEILDPEKEARKEAKKEGKKQIQLERTRTAFERLQLAWIRTSLTLLTIGVGAYEYFYNRLEAGKAPLLKMKHFTGRELGLFLIVTSFVMLLLATLQHTKSMATLKKYYPEAQYSVASLLSYLLLALTLFLSVMVMLRT
ncbi:MAG: DUF202 domain-containing protein [Bacteroidota bacterium]